MTLRTWRRLFVVGFAVLVLQVGVFQQLAIMGAHPDAWLLFAIAAGLVAGAQNGAVIGFVAGVVADLFVVTPFGLSALCFVLVAFIVGITASIPGGRAPHLFRVVSTFIAAIGGTWLYAGLEMLIGQPHVPQGQLIDATVVVSVSAAVMAVPATALIQWALSAGTGPREFVGLAGGSATR